MVKDLLSLIFGGGEKKKRVNFMQVMVQTVLGYGEGRLEFIPLFANLPIAGKQKAEQPCVPK